MKTIVGRVDYLDLNHCRGHYELTLDDEDYERFISQSYKEQVAELEFDGELIVDDYEIDGLGDISEICTQ